MSNQNDQEREAFALIPIERSYEMRAAAILHFNTARKAGADLDDALDAAWRATLAKSHLPETDAAPHPVSGEEFQARVLPWLLECFGQVIADDKTERNHRFLEEALELVQSCGCTEDEAHKLVTYVYGRAVGERSQEVGGVMVTLAALCLAQRLDMHQCGEAELARIAQPQMVERIREKQKGKPAMSPLPGAYADREQFTPAAQDVSGLVEALECIAKTGYGMGGELAEKTAAKALAAHRAHAQGNQP